MQEVLKTLDKSHYPDLVEGGGFAPVFQSELRRLGSSLVIDDKDSLPILWPFIALRDRSCQVLLAAQERSFSVSCWHRGIEYGGGWTPELREVAGLFQQFLERRAALKDLQAEFGWFGATEGGLHHEKSAGDYVEYKWRWWESRAPGSMIDPRLHRLICEAGKCRELRQLLPVTSLGNLCFSRTTGYPFASKNCPYAYALGDDRYRVVACSPEDLAVGESGRVVGEGKAHEAARWLVRAIPEDWGPAIDGTEDDMPH